MFQIVQGSTPERTEHVEEVKTREIWTYPDEWQYRHSESAKQQPVSSSVTSSRRAVTDTSEDERSSVGRTTFTTRTDTVNPQSGAQKPEYNTSRRIAETDWTINVNTSDTWNTKRLGTSYSTASTLEKTKDLDEKVIGLKKFFNYSASSTFNGFRKN